MTGNAASEPFRAFSGGQTNLGGTAVFVFLIVRGFLVTPSLLRSRSLVDFAAKRALCIFPALAVVAMLPVLVLGLAATIVPLPQYLTDEAFRAYFGNIALVGGASLPGVFARPPMTELVNGSLWTLRYEAVCYAFLVLAGAAGLLAWRRPFLVVDAVLVVPGWWVKNRSLYVVAPLDIELAHILRFFAYFFAGVALYRFRNSIVLDARAAIAVIVAVVSLRYGIYYLAFPVAGGYLAVFLGTQDRWCARLLGPIVCCPRHRRCCRLCCPGILS